MAYATLAELLSRFGDVAQVADVDGTGEVDAEKVARALGDADAEIDAALVGRYALPMVPVPELLTRIACDLARESLYDESPTKVVTDRAEKARALLVAIAAGRARFEAPAAPTETSAQGLVEIVTGRRTSPFTGS